jgi:hypothetical protein
MVRVYPDSERLPIDEALSATGKRINTPHPRPLSIVRHPGGDPGDAREGSQRSDPSVFSPLYGVLAVERG